MADSASVNTYTSCDYICRMAIKIQALSRVTRPLDRRNFGDSCTHFDFYGHWKVWYEIIRGIRIIMEGYNFCLDKARSWGFLE